LAEFGSRLSCRKRPGSSGPSFLELSKTRYKVPAEKLVVLAETTSTVALQTGPSVEGVWAGTG